MPIGLGTALSLGSTVVGGLLSSSSSSNAASAANAANQEAIAQAKQRAAEGYATNKSTIQQAGSRSQGYLDNGYSDTRALFQPLMANGDAATKTYMDASGLNGEVARNGYVNTLMGRPEYQAARDLATQQVGQQYSGKLGSGAFARSLQRRDLEYAQQGIDRDLARIKPIMDNGNQARLQQANAATNFGNNSASNTWKTATSDLSNENAFTDNMMNAALASGASNARTARDQGASDAGLYSGLGNAFASAFGGTGQTSRPISTLFS